MKNIANIWKIGFVYVEKLNTTKCTILYNVETGLQNEFTLNILRTMAQMSVLECIKTRSLAKNRRVDKLKIGLGLLHYNGFAI